jgi:hypothetical protein
MLLKSLGIVMGEENIGSGIFEKLIPDFFSIKYQHPSDYVKHCWDLYERYPDKNNNLNGKIFEYILATLCIREGIMPLYLSAKVAFVPNVLFDMLFYCKERGPICWSVKTSLRERYKQADLEAIALKYVHRKSLNYLITLSNEANSVKDKIKSGDVIGLDDVIIATEPEFDEIVLNLKKYRFEQPPTVEVISSNQVVTPERVATVKSHLRNSS